MNRDEIIAPAGVTIARARAGDAPELGALRAEMARELGRETADPARVERFRAACASFFARELAADGAVAAWLARIDGDAVGSATLVMLPTLPRLAAHFERDAPRDARIRSVYVAPAQRKRGIARALVMAAIAEAERRGADRLGLGASVQGRPLYESLGFVLKPDEMTYVRR